MHVRRLNRGYTDQNFVYAPKFPKPQQESWFVLVSDDAVNRVLTLQRLTMSGHGGREGRVEVTVPDQFTGESVTVRVLSDGWRGVDVKNSIAWKSTDRIQM